MRDRERDVRRILAALYREGEGEGPAITEVPAAAPRVLCRHYVKIGLVYREEDYEVLPDARLSAYNIKAGVCPFCGIIYWFSKSGDMVAGQVKEEPDDAPPPASKVFKRTPQKQRRLRRQ